MQSFNAILEELASFSEAYGGVLEVFVVIFAALLSAYILNRFFDRLEKRFAGTHNRWDDTLLQAGRKPAIHFIWAVGIFWALDILHQHSNSALFNAVEPARRVVVIVLLTWFLARLVRGGEQLLCDPARTAAPMDETTARAVSKLLRASIIITASLVTLQTLGYSVSGVLAFGGIGGIAVGFAAKDLLANFFGAMVIYLDRPFSVGEWVRSPDKDIEGTVEEIGWRMTRIRTFDQRPLYVPNSTFVNIAVENPSRMLNRRIHETFGLRYADADKMKTIVDDVTAMLRAHPEIEHEERVLIVNFNSYGPSSLDFFIYTFTKTREWIKFHEIKQDVLLKVYEIIRRHGADIAFPTSTIQIEREIGPEGAPAAAG